MKAAKRFLGKALKGMKSWAHPKTINTDKAPTFGPAIAELKEEGKCPEDTQHRQVKYLNNNIETDHGKLKRLINPVRGFKSKKTAYVMWLQYLRQKSYKSLNTRSSYNVIKEIPSISRGIPGVIS